MSVRSIAVLTAILSGLVIAPASGQALWQPAAPPTVTAEGAQWYEWREPVLFGGNSYYPAGAQVFFDGLVMVEIGSYGGVPLYMDTTRNPGSVILVPIGRGVLQPYERRRTGDLAGTTHSTPPSFPVDSGGAYRSRDSGIPLWSNLPQTVGSSGNTVTGPALSRNVPQTPVLAGAVSPVLRDLPQGRPLPVLVSTPDVAPAPPSDVWVGIRGTASQAAAVAPGGRPRIWIEFREKRWEPDGPPEPFSPDRFILTGDYRGFPVFVDRADTSGGRIYLASRAGVLSRSGFVVPYRQLR